MTIQRRNLPKIDVSDIPACSARTQVGALCWRVEKGKVEVLLITSRETGRWVIPKGWPMKKKSSAEAAAQEAWEEAGVKGRILESCLGFYAYHKVIGPGTDVPCVVSVYPLKVKSSSEKFPEAKERKRRWFSLKKAANKVIEPELQDIILQFDPDSL